MMDGESFLINIFTGTAADGWVILAPPPGDIQRFDLTPTDDGLFVQGDAFLDCTENIEIDSKYQGFRKLMAGESAFFLRTCADAGPGVIWGHGYGAIKEIPIHPPPSWSWTPTTWRRSPVAPTIR